MEISPEFMKIATTLQSIVLSKEDAHENLLHVARMQLEPYIFEILQKRYDQLFQINWNSIVIPKVSNKALVIVERRCHPNLEFCIQNAIYFNADYTLHIFCSEANYNYVKYICGKQFENIHIHVIWKGIGTPSQGKKEYNDLLRTRTFWETFSEKHVLLFETDCYFLRRTPSTLYDYDYVAAKWMWMHDKPGGGGLSYRKPTVMLDICDRCGDNDDKMQDCYASNAIATFGYTFPNLEKNSEFFIESQLDSNSKPFGVHQWWTFLLNVPQINVNNYLENYLTLFV
jgi:hypothetical protein